SSLSFEQAAAIPVNYLTAYALLYVMGSLHAGESVLIHNAGGGVGLAGVDLVIDPIGGGHWKKSYSALRHTGRLGMFGVSAASANGLQGKLKLVKAALQMPRFHPLG